MYLTWTKIHNLCQTYKKTTYYLPNINKITNYDSLENTLIKYAYNLT